MTQEKNIFFAFLKKEWYTRATPLQTVFVQTDLGYYCYYYYYYYNTHTDTKSKSFKNHARKNKKKK